MLRSGIATLKHGPDPGITDERIQRILSGVPGGSDLEKQIGTYMLHNDKVSRERLTIASMAIRPETTEAFMGSVAAELKNEGRMEGRAQGRLEGRTEGRAEGSTRTLLKLLGNRLGPVPEPVRAHIQAWVATDHDGCLDTVMEAKSFDDVLLAPDSR